MIRRIAPALDPITRGWAIVFSGSMARLALGLVASVLIARSLGPAGFGVYAVLAAASGIAGAFADAGLSDAAVKRIASVWPENPTEAELRARAFFWMRLAAAGLVFCAGTLLSGPLSRLLGLQQGETLLVLALAGVLATAASGAVTTVLQAPGHFGRVTLVMLTNAVLTALLAGVLALSGQLTIVTALLALGAGTSVASFAAGLYLLPDGWALKPPRLDALRKEGGALLRFGLWLWLGGMLAMLAAQLDLLLVNRWLDAATVGAYGLALNLASKVEVVNQSLYTVLLPAASALRGGPAEKRYLRTGTIRGLIVCALLLPLFPLAEGIIVLLYGPAYAPAAFPFRLLLGIALFELMASPFLLLVFPRDRARLQAAADAVRAAVLAVAGVGLIPVLGLTGAVAARLLSRVAGAVFTLALLFGAPGNPLPTPTANPPSPSHPTVL